MSSHKKIRAAVIGAGRIGKIHTETLARRISDVDVVAVADTNLAAARELAGQYQVKVATDEVEAIFADPQIDAVLICSSTDTHADLIIKAALAGKHIFCEKPIDHQLAKIDLAISAVEKAGVQCQIGFNRRFDLNFSKVKELVEGGKIGTPHLLRITSRDPAPPPLAYIRVSGGLFLDMSIHDFDMARYLAGSEVEEVFAAGAVLVDSAIGEAGDIDTALITLRFANGAIGSIDNSRQAAYGYDQRVEVFGSKGMAAVSNNTPSSAVVSDAEGVHGEKPLYFFLERYMDSFVTELQAFISAIRSGSPVPVNIRDGRKPVVMALAAQRSLVEKRAVRLAEID